MWWIVGGRGSVMFISCGRGVCCVIEQRVSCWSVGVVNEVILIIGLQLPPVPIVDFAEHEHTHLTVKSICDGTRTATVLIIEPWEDHLVRYWHQWWYYWETSVVIYQLCCSNLGGQSPLHHENWMGGRKIDHEKPTRYSSGRLDFR